MRAFKITLYVLALIPLLTGALDFSLGLRAQGFVGAQLAPDGRHDPVLDGQVRFLGAVWFGFGLLLLVALSDLEKHASLLRAALGIVFLGGLGRVLSLAQYGWPATEQGAGFVVAASVIEVVGMPLLLWWHARVANGG